MKILIMDRVVALLAEQPGLRIRDVVAAMPDVDRSTISSTLHRLSMRGVIVRRAGTNGRFRYSVATGQIIPLIPASTTVHPDDIEPPLPLPAMPMISQAEWERRYAAAVCSLSQVLERDSIPQRYFLSSKACAGILRRTENRKRQFPPLLQTALEHVVQTTTRDKQDT